MLGSKGGLLDYQGPLQLRSGAGQVALVAEHPSEGFQGEAYLDMVGAEGGFLDGQGTLEVGAGAGQVALVAEQEPMLWRMPVTSGSSAATVVW
jgi:hypothetical protein